MSETPKKRKRAGRRAKPQAIQTPYEILGIGESATSEEIRSAYLGRVRQFTPERDPEGFKRVQAAYMTLRDAVKRKTLDLSLFRKELAVEKNGWTEPDYLELFKARVFMLLLASSDFTRVDFSPFFTNVEDEVGRLS